MHLMKTLNLGKDPILHFRYSDINFKIRVPSTGKKKKQKKNFHLPETAALLLM